MMAPEVEYEMCADTSMKEFDPVTFEILRVNAEDIAGQISRNDLDVFKCIAVSELTSCAWTSKSKLEEAPNVVEFTRRFNSTSNLARSEILHGQTAEHRAQLIRYFIRLAKKLYQMNNLHATWAIISALQTQAIFRLSQTWEKVPKTERNLMGKFVDLFSEKDNFNALRNYMENTTMPCIPHLGLYLTDLVFMNDMLKKAKSFDDRSSIQENINKLLRSLLSFQDSYYDIPFLPHIQSYLADSNVSTVPNSSTENDLFALSLRCEPDQPPDSDSLDSIRRSSLPLSIIRSITNSAPKPTTCERKSSIGGSRSPTIAARFRRGHKKTASWGDGKFLGIHR